MHTVKKCTIETEIGLARARLHCNFTVGDRVPALAGSHL
jgi:hypothetical protein